MIAGQGGNVDKVDKWGVRKLAYRVQKRTEGFYVLLQFTAKPETVKELERQLAGAGSGDEVPDGAHRRKAEEDRQAEKIA